MTMNDHFLYFLAFFSCLVALTLVILTGHGSDPLITAILGGGAGGTGAQLAVKWISGKMNDPPNGGPRLPLAIVVLLAFALVISGCAGFNVKTRATVCATVASGLRDAAALKKTGHISPAQDAYIKKGETLAALECHDLNDAQGTQPSANLLDFADTLAAIILAGKTAQSEPAK